MCATPTLFPNKSKWAQWSSQNSKYTINYIEVRKDGLSLIIDPPIALYARGSKLTVDTFWIVGSFWRKKKSNENKKSRLGFIEFVHEQ